MVYRGKPSAGCEACRKAKKKCTLEQPSCARCVKLKKPCSGYRDTSALQIQDETLSVTRKAEKKAQHPSALAAPRIQFQPPSPASGSGWKQSPERNTYVSSSNNPANLNVLPENRLQASGSRTHPGDASLASGTPTPSSMLTPATMNSDSSSGSSSDNTIEISMEDITYDAPSYQATDFYGDPDATSMWIPDSIIPKPDDIAVTYFLSRFTTDGHWEFVPKYAAMPRLDPCLNLAIKACGMAALDNIQFVPKGREWSRRTYIEALSMLNASLRDPMKSKTDESLIAVSMLSLYENLVCDSKQSIQSWKAHIKGASQLLKLRGKAQLKSNVGRTLFREMRAQIMVYCLWDDINPPAFCRDWAPDLAAESTDLAFIKPADDLVDLCFDFAILENKVKLDKISDTDALLAINAIDTRFVQWAIDASNSSENWRYYDLEVDDSPHVWNGMVHAYSGFPAPGVFNTYRSVRIMVTRTQQLLGMRLAPSPEAIRSQSSYFRTVRRQLTDEICATIPCQLGHARPAFTSPCVLVTAYNSIWPLFFAGTCVLERIGQSPWKGDPLPDANFSGSGSSAAIAQILWIIGRFDYISHSVGLRWADGVAATLRGDFRIHEDLRPESHPAFPRENAEKSTAHSAAAPDVIQRASSVGGGRNAEFIREVEESGRGPRALLNEGGALSDRYMKNKNMKDKNMKDTSGPKWLDQSLGGYELSYDAK